MVIGLQTTNELPIELECFLIKYGFFESERAPGSKRNGAVYIPEKVADEYKAWKPSFPGEEPPF